ncbi:MAG: transposase [Propionivibrio sp.]|nr:transposase [Propionivibrio sp.]
MGRHVHVHALVAGGALSDAGVWIRPKTGFLFPVRALSKVFRGKFVAGLEGLRISGRWPESVKTNVDWPCLKHALHAHDWVVYAKQPLGGPEAVLDYLGRYTHRVAISNERIVGIDGNDVLFRVRADRSTGKKRTIHLPGTEFIGRFLHHVLPPGFKRIRHYGLLSPARKKNGLAAARAALGVPPPHPEVIESVDEFLRRVARIEPAHCPHCGIGQFRVSGCSCVSLADRPTFLRQGGHRERGRRRTPQPLSKRWKHRFRGCLRVRVPSSSVALGTPNRMPGIRRVWPSCSAVLGIFPGQPLCQTIDFPGAFLTIPITTALPAVPSNKVYPPR